VENLLEKYGVRVKEGDEVVFLGEGGFPYQLENALKILEPNKIYAISSIFVDKWGVYYYLKGITSKSFPEDMFERV
jgi:hypothetical protein